MIIRTKKYLQFTTLPNEPINNRELSYEALGVWVYLMSKPDNWKVSMTDIRNRFKGTGRKYGKEVIQNIFKELNSFGLAEYVPGGVSGGSFWLISDTMSGSRKNRQPEKPVTGKTGYLVNTDNSLLNTKEEREEALPNFKETTSENHSPLNASSITMQNRGGGGAARASYEKFIKAFGVKDNYKLQTEAMRISPQEWEEIENHLPGYINRTDTNGKDNKPFRATAIGYLKSQTWVNNPNTVKEVATAPILKRF